MLTVAAEAVARSLDAGAPARVFSRLTWCVRANGRRSGYMGGAITLHGGASIAVVVHEIGHALHRLASADAEAQWNAPWNRHHLVPLMGELAARGEIPEYPTSRRALDAWWQVVRAHPRLAAAWAEIEPAAPYGAFCEEEDFAEAWRVHVCDGRTTPRLATWLAAVRH